MGRSSSVTAVKTAEAVEDAKELISSARSDVGTLEEKLDALHAPVWEPANQLPHWQEIVKPSWAVDVETWARSLEYHVVVLNEGRLEASEVLIPRCLEGWAPPMTVSAVTVREDWIFDGSAAREELETRFAVQSMKVTAGGISGAVKTCRKILIFFRRSRYRTSKKDAPNS